MSKKDCDYKSIIHHPQGGYELHEKKMIIPKVISEDYSWEMVTGMKYIPERKEIIVSDAMFRSGTSNLKISDICG